MPNYTLSYNKDSTGRRDKQGGWPSFYSYIPNFMIGMNSFFYSFSAGNLYRHNTNSNRNEYYNISGNLNPSTITSVFNPKPTQAIKLFKTMSYESSTTSANSNAARWACTELQTDLTDGLPGGMLKTFFKEKEGEWFSFIRTNVNVVNFAMRSATGISSCIAVSGPVTAAVIEFSSAIPDAVNIGDNIFSVTSAAGVAAGSPALAGPIIALTSTSVTVNVDLTVAGSLLPTVGQFIISLKNSQAESHGARGYYMQFKLENDSTSPVELFSVGSSIMQSYPAG